MEAQATRATITVSGEDQENSTGVSGCWIVLLYTTRCGYAYLRELSYWWIRCTACTAHAAPMSHETCKKNKWNGIWPKDKIPAYPLIRFQQFPRLDKIRLSYPLACELCKSMNINVFEK